MAESIIKNQGKTILRTANFSGTTNAAGAVLGVTSIGNDKRVILVVESTTPVNLRLFPFITSDGSISLQSFEYTSTGLKPLPQNISVSGKYYYLDLE